ncbi:hypothetical protein J3Q64DRAFT_1767625, partial [Phycomyces blakesleeanus]
MAATTYQRVGGNGELGSLLFNLFYPGNNSLLIYPETFTKIFLRRIHQQDYDDYTNNRSPGSSNLPTEEAVDYGGIKTTGKCELPRKITIAPTISFVTKSEYEDYCQQWDPATGFTDAEPYNTRGECGTWQEKYTALHKHNLQGFTDSDRPTYISYVCMISTFFFALITDRAYLANWAEGNPIPLELLFDRPNVDWELRTLRRYLICLPGKDSLLGMEQVDLLNQNIPYGFNYDFNALWNASYIEVRSNRMSSVYPERLESIGLTKENAFGCLADYIRRFLNAYKQMFEMNSILNPVHKQPHHKRVVYFLVTDSLKLRDEFVNIGTGHKDTTTVDKRATIEHIEPAQIAKYIDVEIPKEINRARMTP